MILAHLDWLVHLANSPGKVGERVQNAAAKSLPLLRYAQSSALGLRGIDPVITRRWWSSPPASCST